MSMCRATFATEEIDTALLQSIPQNDLREPPA